MIICEYCNRTIFNYYFCRSYTIFYKDKKMYYFHNACSVMSSTKEKSNSTSSKI